MKAKREVPKFYYAEINDYGGSNRLFLLVLGRLIKKLLHNYFG